MSIDTLIDEMKSLFLLKFEFGFQEKVTLCDQFGF